MQPNDNTPVIDFHSHFLVQEVFDQCRGHSPASGFGHHQAPAHLVALFEKMKNPRLVIEDMDRLKIDLSVFSSATVLEPTAWAEPVVELALVRRLNDTIAQWAAHAPRRIIGSFVLPLQDMNLALQELTRAVGLGLRVANLPSEVRGAYLGDRQFWPFWEAAQDLGVVSFMHPEGGKCAWFQQFGMWNSLAQSLEEAKFMASIIYEGVLESFPRLKLVVAHGGGYFPHNMGRLDRNVKNAPQSMKNITRRPSEYLRSVHYDTCLFDPSVLSALLKIVGA
ncbi:MAG: amidohydrolase, partial [Deltaproteobacteria bacterium]|nr:amidohydrolase [Deltaproteobacteria bacterium]